MVRDVPVGGGAPISVQSMTTTQTHDAQQTLAQIQALADEGCEIIRVAVPNKKAFEGFGDICRLSPLPVVADIHFDYRLALGAIDAGAHALRINPGNIGSMERVDIIIDAAREHKIPIRIGVNAGSLDKSVDLDQTLTLPQKLVASSLAFVEHFRSRNFEDIVVSAKAHDVPATLATYRELARVMPEVPLHIGVTEAGTLQQGTVKSAVGLGALMEEGIGDTVRVSLTADPVEEVKVAWLIQASLNIRRRSPEIVSCPTCGRCRVDLLDLADRVDKRLQKSKLPISVAVMGCAVNGPGEARDADVGVACGDGQGLIFCKGKIVRRASEEEIFDVLFEEIEARFGNMEEKTSLQ